MQLQDWLFIGVFLVVGPYYSVGCPADPQANRP